MKAERKTKTAATKARKSRTRDADCERVVLFPLEPPTIPREQIEAAIRTVIARNKGDKVSS